MVSHMKEQNFFGVVLMEVLCLSGFLVTYGAHCVILSLCENRDQFLWCVSTSNQPLEEVFYACVWITFVGAVATYAKDLSKDKSSFNPFGVG